MADDPGEDEVVLLDPRRNQYMEKKKLFEEMLLKEIPGTSRANEPMHAVLEGEVAESEMTEGKEAQNVRNRALLHYLASLANSNSTKDTFDFDFVESLFKNGADVNSADKTGQTVFHEVARSWNVDVAKFLLNHGANVNQQDQYGRSPLHVAAAVDYAEMVDFLLENGADIDIKTSGEGQTPIHFAAKNDAINSLQMLLGYGADIDGRDSKNRTPLQVAAEMNRSKAAKLLIAKGAPAGVCDNLGNSALSLLIEKIPEVALDAMDQFHSVDTVNRKEFYFLNYLESTKLKEKKTPARTPLEIAVQNERFDIIMHPVMQRLIGVKWQMYGKWAAILDLVLNLLYTILWTILAVTLPRHGKDLYVPLVSNIWRIVIVGILILLTLNEIRKQILNTIRTQRDHKGWKEWRASELERDIEYCHPRWPQEAQYVNAEIKAVRNLSLMSGSDHWIYFDWVALVLIFATIASHLVFFHYSTDLSKEVHHYITMPLLLVLWLRMFKYARPFEGAGPFIVIFGSVVGDIVKWGFFNIIICIPFACAFWMTFGNVSTKPVEGYNKVGPLLYNIFSMMVGNGHRFEYLERTKPFMARLLTASFIAVGAIVTLNLLIALLTNTFERLYENAIANAVMQRARTLLLLEKSLWRRKEANYYEFIRKHGSPEVISKNIGRLLSLDRDEATIERVRDDVSGIVAILAEKFGKKSRKGKKSDLDFVRMDVSKMQRFQQEIVIDVKNIKLSLEEIKAVVSQVANNSSSKKSNDVTVDETKESSEEDDNSTSNDETKNDNSSSSSDDDEVQTEKKAKTKPPFPKKPEIASKKPIIKPRVDRPKKEQVEKLRKKFEQTTENVDKERRHDRKDKPAKETYEENDDHDERYDMMQGENNTGRRKIRHPSWRLVGLCQPTNLPTNTNFSQPCSHHVGQSQYQERSDIPMHSKKNESRKVTYFVDDHEFQMRPDRDKNNLKCLQFHPEKSTEVYFGQNSSENAQPHNNNQFSSDRIYSTPRRKRVSFNEFDMARTSEKQHSADSSSRRRMKASSFNEFDMTKNNEKQHFEGLSTRRNKMTSFNEFDLMNNVQKQQTGEYCQPCYCETDDGVRTCHHHDVQDTISTNNERALWKNTHYEDRLNQPQQTFSSTFLHFDDDLGYCSHSIQPNFSRNRLSGRRRPVQQARNENIGPRCRHSDSRIVEIPYVERIYHPVPAINSDFSSSEGN
ncbi:uncharacterized protein LOC114528490 [Dendronephthya gigantea]|uniref:uncharacterized protein LOC114528490 n=1 Tax=Dendronephthya gigantea TaxID=151771 RepID=UPI00106C6B97|nr:uncharacterized protein LOC114528490 [Dendronephthya gigantea]